MAGREEDANAAGAWRLADYKNQGRDVNEMRRERNATSLELRKSKRDETLFRRRNLPNPEEDDGDFGDDLDDWNDHEEVALEVSRRIDEVLTNARSTSPEVRFEGVQALRKMLSSTRWPPVTELIQKGALPILVTCLAPTEPTQLQFQATWALTNIVSGTSEQTRATVEAGVVPALLVLLSSPDKEVSEQAVWALANIIGEGPQLRDFCISSGVIPALRKFVDPATPESFLRNITWALANLCRNEEPCMPINVVQELLELVTAFLSHTDQTILVNAFWALSFLMDPNADILQLFIDIGMVGRLVPFLGHTDSKVTVPVLRILGNLTTGTDAQTQVLLDAGILTYFPQLLTCPKEKVHQGAVWLLSNVLAGSEHQVQMVIDANLLPLLRQHLATSAFSTQKEAAWAFSNMTLTCTQKQIDLVVEQGVVGPLCELLTVHDSQVVRVTLNTLNNLLKLATAPATQYAPITEQIEGCGGLDKIESLQYSNNESIHKLASTIIDEHWNGKSERSPGAMIDQPALQFPVAAPVAPQQGFQF